MHPSKPKSLGAGPKVSPGLITRLILRDGGGSPGSLPFGYEYFEFPPVGFKGNVSFFFFSGGLQQMEVVVESFPRFLAQS